MLDNKLQPFAASSGFAQLRGVSKFYGQTRAVDGLDLDLHIGTTTAILGPNGAGKTTLLNLLLGLVRADRGALTLFGFPPGDMRVRRRLGAMLQISGVPPTLAVAELLTQFRGYYPDPFDAPQVLALAGIGDLATRRYGRLSGGQKQRVLFALAVCGQPDLLFLDEPTVGMDVGSRRNFWQTIRALSGRSRAIVLTTHYLEEADALADRVIVVDRGSVIADGSPDQIKSLVSVSSIRCRTQLEVARIRRMRGVTIASVDAGGYMCVSSTQPEDTVRALLADDPQLTNLEVRGAALEDAFLQLTESAAARGGV